MADIWINILGDSSKLTGALGQAGGQVDKFAEKIGKIGRTMTIVGGAVTAAFGAIILKTTQLGDTYDKMAKRTNVSVEALSALGYAAKISGADLDTVEKSLRYLARGMNDAAQGVGESLEAFEYLNIEVLDTEGNLRDTVDVLKEAATKLAAMTDETKQIALATEIFGARYGTQLLPMLKEGGAGIEALMKKAKELGVVMSTEAAAKAAEFNDRLTDLKESIGAAGRGIGEILMPTLIKLAEKAIEIIKKIKDWAEAHKPLVEMIIKVVATLGVLAAVGGPVLMAVSVFMKMKGAIAAVGVALKVLGGLATTNPIGMVIMAVGALYLAWTTNFGGIRDFVLAVVEKVTEALGWLWDKVRWVLEKLGLYKEKTEEVEEVTDELTTSLETASTAVDNLAIENEELATSFDNVTTGAREASEAIKIYAEDVAENYIALSVKATESWEDFYRFWEAEAERTAEEVIETIEKVAKKMYKVLGAKGEILGFRSEHRISQEEALAGVTLEEFKTGTPFVKKTGVYKLDVGERVLTAKENITYDQQKKEINININNPVVRNDNDITKIKQQVEVAFWEFIRQYGRSGFELPV